MPSGDLTIGSADGRFSLHVAVDHGDLQIALTVDRLEHAQTVEIALKPRVVERLGESVTSCRWYRQESTNRA